MIGKDGKDEEGNEFNCVMCGMSFSTDRALRVRRRSCGASLEERRSQEFEQVHQEKANTKTVEGRSKCRSAIISKIIGHYVGQGKPHSAKQNANASHDPRSYQKHFNKSRLPQDFKYDRKPH